MSSVTKFTSGPLMVQREQGSSDFSVWTREPHTGTVATFYTEDMNGEYPAKANAQLFAAAPELYEALFSLVNCMPKDGGMVRFDGEELASARAALAKATGA